MSIDDTPSGGNGFDDDGFGVPAPRAMTGADYALSYREYGIQVVPAAIPATVPSEDGSWKHPVIKWEPLQNKLISDEDFGLLYGPGGKFSARHNMGMICGECSGRLFIIDLDLYKSPAALNWWCETVGPRMEPETVEQITGGGGVQKLFRAPPGWTPPTCKTPLGVDIRGQGGFAVLPPSLHNSGQLYRWAPGQSPDDVPVANAEPWLCEAIDRLVKEHGGTPKTNGQTGQNGQMSGSVQSHDAFGHIVDGREQYMTDMVWAALVKLRKESPAPPNEQMMLAEYEVYARGVRARGASLEEDGRGISLWRAKWLRAVEHHWWDKLAREAEKPGRERISPGFEETPQNVTLYPSLNVRQIKARQDPVWVVEGLIGERALGFIFGPPSSLKTFIALDLALCLAGGCVQWWDRKLSHHGVVVYLCREGTASLKFRIEAWERKWGLEADDYSFQLIEATINFMTEADVVRLIATVRDLRDRAGLDVSAIFVDTVSRVLPGAKENQQEDMTMFIHACEKLQEVFQCLVVGLHHTNKNGGIRGSTVIPGAGDFLIETRREPPAMSGSLFTHKVKDGVDGAELPFVVEKVEGLGTFGTHSSLVVCPAGAGAGTVSSGSRDGLPDRDTCIQILAALDEAWRRDMPWSKQGARPAHEIMMSKWRVKVEPAKRLLRDWVANEIIEYKLHDTRYKIYGFKKTNDL